MLRLLAILVVACALQAADRWVEVRSGPFQVLSSVGERAGRDRLYELEQFRYGMEQLLGKTEINPIWPIRILVVRSAKDAPAGLGLARDAFYGAVPERGLFPSSLLRACAVLLLESGEGRLPDEMEKALADLFSTVEFKGWQAILGAPPPAPARTSQWAKMHMLAVSNDYFGKLRTLV
ncbi:MAG TPA: hypothetical protein VLH09_03485, partial [Bryobacteraceae bacterium]|nr:hypothetical protein [Bryobacteraceae bacterium]